MWARHFASTIINYIKWNSSAIFVTATGSGQSRKENKDMSSEKNTTKVFSNYIKHWVEAMPWGWEIRILTEKRLHTFHCKWKDYKRPRELTKRERCPHN
jgi:hypothetical protein